MLEHFECMKLGDSRPHFHPNIVLTSHAYPKPSLIIGLEHLAQKSVRNW